MGDRTEAWFGRRTTRWQDWPPRRLLELKQQLGSRISVVIPARNEARTVAGVAGAISRSLGEQGPLGDELVVIDSDSGDGTAEGAARARAVVYPAPHAAPPLGSLPSQGAGPR